MGTAQQPLFLVYKVVLHAVVVIVEVLHLSTKSRCSRCCRAHLYLAVEGPKVGSGCGNPGCSDGVAMGAGQHRCDTGTSEPDLARTSCYCLGRIAIQVSVS